MSDRRTGDAPAATMAGMRTCAVVVLLMSGIAPVRAEEPPPPPPLADALAAAVDLPDPAARAEAARRVAQRPDATVAALLPLMKGFGAFAPQKPGMRTATVPLFDGKKPLEAEVAVYTPPGYDPAKPAPVLLAAHAAGAAGKDEAAAWTAVADALGMVVVAPTDPGANKGYDFSVAERSLALSALRWARRKWNIDENRVFLTGASRGGHLAWDLGLRRPDLFAAVVPCIGGPRLANTRGENNLRFLENLSRTPLRDLQGAQDDEKLLLTLRTVFARFQEWGHPDARLIEFPDRGHDFDLAAVDWKEWLGKARRDPLAAEVVRLAVDRAEARNLWAEILDFGKGAKEQFTLPVDPRKWNAMTDFDRREAFEKAAEEHTARLRVKRTAPGVYEAEGREVERFRILLPEGGFEPGKPVAVAFTGRTVKAVPRPDPRVLLADFVERFDRTFLPVAEVRVP